MRRRSAGYRIAGITALIFVGAATVLGAIMLLFVHVWLSRSLDAEIAAEAHRLELVWRDKGRAALLEAVRDEERSRHGHLAHAIFGPDGRRLAGDLVIAPPAPGWSDTKSYDPIEGNDPARVLALALPGGDSLAVASSSRPVEEMNEFILWLFASLVVVVAILSLLLAVLLGRYLKGRLLRISGTADAIIAGDLSQRVAPSGTGDEFDRIASSLNAMLDRIADLVAGVRRVSSDVAHDLKTPLARLRARTEQALISNPAPSPHREALEYTLEQIDEVLRLFDGMLRIAEIEEGGSGPRCERFNLAELVGKIEQAMTPVFEEEGRRLVVQVDPGIAPCGDDDLVATAVINLLENVLRHTPPGTDARLVATIAGDGVDLTVSDHGPGVPDATRDLLLTRFYRADPARTSYGHGLGLSLVAAVMRAHGGRTMMSDNRPGLAVTLSLPERAGCPAPEKAAES